jgi:glutamate dehydrogenase (NAD(P)+)
VLLRPGVSELGDRRLGLTGYLVIDRVAGGLCAGGLRFGETVSSEGLQRLARLMTLKFGVMGMEIGGAKAGIVGRRGGVGDAALLRRMAELLKPYLEAGYLLAEDLGTNGADVVALYRHAGVNPAAVARARTSGGVLPPDVLAGPPPSAVLAGEFARDLAGIGVAEAVITAADVLGLPLDGLTVAIQGFGTVGSATARRLAAVGVPIVAVADEEVTVMDPRGLEVDDVDQARDLRGRICRERLHRSVTTLSSRDWYRLPVQVLIPAAVEDAIGLRDLPRLGSRLRLVVEAANCPVTPEAEAPLERSGVAIVPDFVANAGSAVGLGLLATGQVRSPTEIAAECCRRIASATRRILGNELPGDTVRQRATALAGLAEIDRGPTAIG